MVYEEALLFSKTDSCCAQLLVANRQVWGEAEPIFRKDNPVDVSVFHDFGRYNSVSVRNDCLEIQGLNNYGDDFYNDVEAEWPSMLRSAQAIRFHITRDEKKPWNGTAWTNSVLYSLCSFLHGRHALNTFTLEIQDLDKQRTSLSGLEIYPIRMLGNLAKLDLIGISNVIKMHLDKVPCIYQETPIPGRQHTPFQHKPDLILTASNLQCEASTAWRGPLVEVVNGSLIWIHRNDIDRQGSFYREDFEHACDQFTLFIEASSDLASTSTDDLLVYHFLTDPVDTQPAGSFSDRAWRLMRSHQPGHRHLPVGHHIIIRLLRVLRADIDASCRQLTGTDEDLMWPKSWWQSLR